jgi:hypothetical protein
MDEETDGEDVVSRRQLFLGWGSGLRRTLSDVVSARLPLNLLDSLEAAPREVVPISQEAATAQLFEMLGLTKDRPGE